MNIIFCSGLIAYYALGSNAATEAWWDKDGIADWDEEFAKSWAAPKKPAPNT